MPKRSKSPLNEDSAVNSVGARLALYTAIAGAVGAGTAIALKRRNRRDTEWAIAEAATDKP